MAISKIWFSWITAHDDLTEHAVSDNAHEASLAAGAGTFEALCGIRFLAASMDVGPARRCPRCASFVRARNTMRDLDQRMAAGRRSALLSWLPCPTRSHGRHAA